MILFHNYSMIKNESKKIQNVVIFFSIIGPFSNEEEAYKYKIRFVKYAFQKPPCNLYMYWNQS